MISQLWNFNYNSVLQKFCMTSKLYITTLFIILCYFNNINNFL